MTATATQAGTYYVTSKGAHRHSSWACANNRRTIHTGSVVTEAGAEHAELPLCEHCNDTAALAADAKVQEAAAAARAEGRCTGGEMSDANPRHMKPRGTCPSCGRAVGSTGRGSRRTATHKAWRQSAGPRETGGRQSLDAPPPIR